MLLAGYVLFPVASSLLTFRLLKVPLSLENPHPVMVQVLEGEDAIAKNREVMGATNPAEAAAGTIRKDFAESVEANAVHGSDAPETAAQEIAFFFAGTEICERTR